MPPLLGLQAIGYGAVSYIIASRVSRASRREQEAHPSDYGLAFEDVEFASRGDGVRLRGWLLPGSECKPAIIFVHGMGSERTGNQATGLAARLVSIGHSVLMFDLRGHGASSGDKVSGGYFEQSDVLGAFDFLVRRGVPSERIGVLGASMGAATSLMAAAREPRIRAIVVDSPYARASDLIAREAARKTILPAWAARLFMPGAKLAARLLFGMDIGSVSPEKAVSRLGYPILVIHGTDDTRIPLEQGLRVYRAAHPRSRLWVAHGVDHVDAFKTYPDEYARRVADYFEERLGAVV